MNAISIIDKDYKVWLEQLSERYRQSQICAAVKVNQEQLRFYYLLGKDIADLKAESRWGNGFYDHLSKDLQTQLPNASCFSVTNLKYIKYFYELYNQCNINCPQVGDELQVSHPQDGDELLSEIFCVPWGHHKLLIDKFKMELHKALFYVHKIVENGWSRAMLMNFVDTDLYEREGKAVSNFTKTLPAPMSDLAQEITKDPYSFGFAGITGQYNETTLKAALLTNITKFLTELGTGFAYVGKEYRLQIDVKEKFIDLLFYNLNLSCYVVVEVKIGDFDFADMGQVNGYVVAVNHLLRKEGRDNPTIGILICKSKNSTLAQYALEGSNQPIAISEYDLQRLYPKKVEGIIPTIEELEKNLEM